MGPLLNDELGHIDSSYPDVELSPLNPQWQLDIIWVTQLHARSSKKGNIYKIILASVTVDSPSVCIENIEEEGIEQGQVGPLLDTPICNSASSLIALGQYP